MFDSQKRQFIFKTSVGKILNLYHNEKLGICTRILTKKNLWSEPQYIFQEAYHEFYAHMDQNDNHHIVCQDLKGSLIYIYSGNTVWHNIPILKSKSPYPTKKQPFICSLDKQTHIFYTIYHGENLLLIHQPFTEKIMKHPPKVIDYLEPKDFPYAIVTDNINNIYAIYLSKNNSANQISCKKYIKENMAWAKHPLMQFEEKNIQTFKVLLDANDMLHVITQSVSNNQTAIVYSQRIMGNGDTCCEDKIVYSGKALINNISILETDNKLIIYWFSNNIMYYSQSTNNGQSWSAPSEYLLPTNNKYIYCIVYSTNLYSETNKICSLDLPGILLNGFKLAFIQNSLSINSDKTYSSEPNARLTDAIKTFNIRTDSLEKKYYELYEKLSYIYSTIENYEKEIFKNAMKITSLENRIEALETSSTLLANDINNQHNETCLETPAPTEDVKVQGEKSIRQSSKNQQQKNKKKKKPKTKS